MIFKTFSFLEYITLCGIFGAYIICLFVPHLRLTRLCLHYLSVCGISIFLWNLRHTLVFLWNIWGIHVSSCGISESSLHLSARLEIAWSDLWDRITTFYYNLYITLKHWLSCDVLFKESNFCFRKENGLIPLSSQPSGLNFCVFFLFLLF